MDFFNWTYGKFISFFEIDIFKIRFAIIRKSFYSYSDLNHTSVLSCPHCFGLPDMADMADMAVMVDTHGLGWIPIGI